METQYRYIIPQGLRERREGDAAGDAIPFIKDRLKEFGLNERDSTVYLALVSGGPLKASELARCCDLGRMDMYRTLKRLQEYAVVEASFTRPMRFVAKPFEEAIELLIHGMREKIRLMERDKEELVSLWSSIDVPATPVECDRMRITKGRSEFLGTIRRMCESARKEILIMTTANGLARMYHYGIDEDLLRKTEHRVRVKILAERGRSQNEILKRFRAISTFRTLPNPIESEFVIIDGSEILVSTILDDLMQLNSKKDRGMWSNSQGLVLLMKRLFEELWSVETGTPTSISGALSLRVPSTTRLKR